MISLPNPTNKMTLSQEQYDQLLVNYAEQTVEGMDLDCLIQFAVEQIELNLRENCSMDEELVEEISQFYDEEYVASMLEDVGANPADFNINVQGN
jgi:hypothetical protein